MIHDESAVKKLLANSLSKYFKFFSDWTLKVLLQYCTAGQDEIKSNRHSVNWPTRRVTEQNRNFTRSKLCGFSRWCFCSWPLSKKYLHLKLIFLEPCLDFVHRYHVTNSWWKVSSTEYSKTSNLKYLELTQSLRTTARYVLNGRLKLKNGFMCTWPILKYWYAKRFHISK